MGSLAVAERGRGAGEGRIGVATVTNDRRGEPLDPKAKSAIRGAFLGFYVDIFDIYLPIVVLAPALIYFVSPQIGGTASAIVGASIFAAALVGRPIGALIFGRFADTIGRRKTTIIAVSGFGATTLLLALMPGYQQIGITAVVLFIILRFVDGIFLGGEYTSASPLAMEYSPREKRGLYGALIMTGFPLAYATISLITMFLLFVMPSEGLNSAYVQWGWRIPFLIGAALAFGFVYYYARSVSESEIFEQSGGSESPIKDLFSGDNLKNFLQVFVMMTGFWLTLNMVSAALPGLLGDPVGLSSTSVTITLVIANLVLVGGYVSAGVISQRVGRRPFLIVMGATMAIVGTFLYYLLVSAAPQNLFVVILLTTLISVLVVSPWGLATTYINERFQTGVRASGFGLGYSLAVIIPSFYAFYQAGLATFMPAQYTALVLLVIGALLIVVGAAWGPETKDVDFSEEPEVSASRDLSEASTGTASASGTDRS